MTGEIHQNNELMYQNKKLIKLYSSKDKNPQDSKIDFNEANEGSIFDFTAAELVGEINKENDISKRVDIKLVKKYLGFDASKFFKDNFEVIKYNESSETDFKEQAQKDLESKINNDINKQIAELKNNLKTTYGDKLKRAIELAEKEKPSLEPQQGDSSKVKEPEMYDAKKAKDGEVASFNSAKPETDDKKKSQGYKNAKDYLVNQKGAKLWKREVNGTVQEVFVYKENGEKKRVIIDDAGQLHELEITKSAGKNAYVTKEVADAARGDDNDAKIKRRKVKADNGEYRYENVVIKKDNEGKKHVQVADQDENTGEVKISENLTAKKRLFGKTRYTGEKYEEKKKDVVTPKEREVKYGIDGDHRDSANAKFGDKHGAVWGVDENLQSQNSNVHKIHYNSTFSRKNFKAEGWYSDKNRAKEKAYLEKMEAAKGNGKATRNLENATEFAARFAEANFPGKKVKIKKLADAIIVANPSIFKSNGEMLKDADFSRLNLPQKIDNYLE